MMFQNRTFTDSLKTWVVFLILAACSFLSFEAGAKTKFICMPFSASKGKSGHVEVNTIYLDGGWSFRPGIVCLNDKVCDFITTLPESGQVCFKGNFINQWNVNDSPLQVAFIYDIALPENVPSEEKTLP